MTRYQWVEDKIRNWWV